MPADTFRLIHVRHGETDWNVEGRLQGQLDIPMNDTGRAQAARNGATLRAYLAREGIDPAALHFVSSPLGRSMETMGLVRQALDMDGSWETDDRLKEIHFGEWASHTYAELKEAGAREAVQARKKDKLNFCPPSGESYAALAARVKTWLDSLTGDTVAVTHGGIFRVLNGHLAGAPWDAVPSLPAPQDRFAVFQRGEIELV